MKNALCISGQPRFYNECYKYLYNNIIKPNNCDVFIHCWCDDEFIKDEIIKLFQPVSWLFEKQKEHLAPEPYGYYKRRAGAPTEVQFSMFYSIKEAMLLKFTHEIKNNFKYENVVKSRFDCAILDLLLLTNYNNDKVYFPDVLRHKGVLCDYFNFGESTKMDIFSKTYYNLHNYHEKGIGLCGENMSIHHLKINGIQTEGINISTFLMRDEKLNNKQFGKKF